MRPETRSAPWPRSGAALALLLLAAIAAAGCRQDMHDQPKLRPYRASTFFADGSGMRPLPAHTVARGDLRDDKMLYYGKGPDGSMAWEMPYPMTRARLVRGRERFDIFCSPCHGRLGDGRGMVVQRGLKQPPSFHDPRLRFAPPGYFFDIMTNGFGVMPSYAAQVPPEDRWAIFAYIRALQLSQNVEVARLSPEELARLDAPAHEGAAAQPGH